MMPNMMPRVGKGQAANVFYNTGHGHLGWTLSAITADMVAQVVATQMPPSATIQVNPLPADTSAKSLQPTQSWIETAFA